MPKGIYKRTEYHKKITRDAMKKAYLSGNHPLMGFQKEHQDIVPMESRKKQGRKMKILHKLRKENNYTYPKNYHWKMSEQGKINIGNSQRGIKRSIEFKEKQRELHKGKKSHWWKGGISPENELIRRRIKYKLWRKSVFVRDDWTCQKTGIKGGKLVAHHIKNFSDYPELRFAIDNGITLSEKTHREFHKKYGKKNNTQKQLNNFLQ